jgi:polar amino acid transport system permease protein
VGRESGPLPHFPQEGFALDLVFNILPAYLNGTVITVQVTLLALAIGLAAGLLIAMLRIYGPTWISRIAAAYITIIRALPEIVALFVFYFVIGGVLPLTPLLAAVLALAAISSAYQAEILRSAIQSLGPSQMLAARAIGMSRPQAIRHIVLPQALRRGIPAWSNEASGMIKASALVYALGIPELLRQAQYVSARTLEPFIAFGTAAVIYLVLTVIANGGLRLLERKVAIPE